MLVKKYPGKQGQLEQDTNKSSILHVSGKWCYDCYMSLVPFQLTYNTRFYFLFYQVLFTWWSVNYVISKQVREDGKIFLFLSSWRKVGITLQNNVIASPKKTLLFLKIRCWSCFILTGHIDVLYWKLWADSVHWSFGFQVAPHHTNKEKKLYNEFSWYAVYIINFHCTGRCIWFAGMTYWKLKLIQFKQAGDADIGRRTSSNFWLVVVWLGN